VCVCVCVRERDLLNGHENLATATNYQRLPIEVVGHVANVAADVCMMCNGCVCDVCVCVHRRVGHVSICVCVFVRERARARERAGARARKQARERARKREGA